MNMCIIGAGTAGLCSARQALQYKIKPTLFEQTGRVGGTWVYTDEIDTDAYGIDVHSSMYQGLRTNLPKEIMGFPDYSIKNFKESYIPAQGILNFLEEYADNFKIKDFILFFHYVLRIRPIGEKWQVIVKNLQNRCISVHNFDLVMICSGHYHTPLYPIIHGSELFKGKQLHSHDYRCAKQFQDEAVLIIGAGPSGMDLCHEISKVASNVTLSHHMIEKPKTIFLGNVTQKPDIKELNENGAYFEDGSYKQFSTIFYCTGYKYAFPFLSVDCGIHVDDNYVQHLYKHCVNIAFPTMAFIGLPFYVCAAQMMDLQARFVLQYFSHARKLPSLADMYFDTKKEMESRWKDGYKKRQAHMMGPQQIEYFNDLAQTGHIENIKPVMTKLHNESSQRFLDDLINFRKDVFKIVDNEIFVKLN